MVEALRERGLLGKVLAAFAAIYFIWGSTFITIRIAITDIPPLLMCGVRLLSAGMILVAWARAAGESWPRGIEWRDAALVGILLPGIGNASVTLGETHVASGLVALLVASIPLWMALLSAIGPRAERPAPLGLLGLALGFTGIALLLGPGIAGPAGSGHSLVWAMTPVAGSFSWAWGSLWSRRARTPRSPRMATGVGLVAGGVLVLLAATVTGEPARFDPARVGTPALLSLAYLSVFGSVVAFSAYLFLLRVVSPALVSTYAFVNPLVAMTLGALFAGEAFSPRAKLAAVLVIASVVLLTWTRARAARRAVAPADAAKA